MIKKHFIKIMAIAVAMFVSANSFAQKDPTIEAAKKMTKGGQFLDANYKVTKPLFAVGSMAGGSPQPADETKHKVSFEIINFGTEGNTVLMTLDLGEDGSTTFSWSGPRLHVVPGYGDGAGMLAVQRGATTCGALITSQGKWIAMINKGSDTYTISDFNKGMTRAQVETVVGKLGMSQFKFTRNSGNLKVYSLFWLDQKKQYNFLGTDYHYELRNDKKYGDFYFDAQGKLVKWLLFM